MKIFIKNMVCDRCILVVNSELEKLGLETVSVILGEAELALTPDPGTLLSLGQNLRSLGFEILDKRNQQVTDKVKTLIIELVHAKNNMLETKLSDYITASIPHDYNYISNLFSQNQNTSIEQYYILQKTERVKELLLYGQMSLGEIAFHLKYSSTAHLSRQFKKVTGHTITEFRQQTNSSRQPLDSI